MRLRTTFRARKTWHGIHFNIGKHGLTSVSATAGPLTVNPSRRSLSIDTPGPGSLRLVATPEEVGAEVEQLVAQRRTEQAQQREASQRSAGYLIGRGLVKLLLGK
jgi:hypothetical protein